MFAKLWTIAAAVLLLAALGMLEQRAVSRLTGEALQKTGEIFAAIRQDRLEEAQQLAEALDLYWDEEAEKLEILIEHGSTDDVRYALSRLIAALEERDHAASLIYTGELEGSVEHVKERQEVSLQNLL